MNSRATSAVTAPSLVAGSNCTNHFPYFNLNNCVNTRTKDEMSHLLSLSTLATNRFTLSSSAAASSLLSVGSPFSKPSSSAYRLGRAFQSKATMTEDESSTKSQKTVIKTETEAEEKPPEKLPPPPPPEKPLPGDCCGNGCVPCVWDIYYEELQDYNKLLAESKTKNKAT